MSYDAWKTREPDDWDDPPCPVCGAYLAYYWSASLSARFWHCEDCDARDAHEQAELEAWTNMLEEQRSHEQVYSY